MSALARSISPGEEEEIIRGRFLTQTATTSGAQIPPFKKLVTKFTQFCRAAASSASGATELNRLYDEVLADLYAIQALLQRLEASAAALSQENEAYASKQHALVTAIDAAEADIVEQKKQLQEARAERDRLIEYEKVRKRIADFPARSSTKLEITFVEKEISDLEKQMKEMDVIIGQRESHFGGVVSMLSQVFCHHQEYCGDASPHQYESVDMKMGVAARETEDGEDAQGEITDEQNEEAPLPMVVDM